MITQQNMIESAKSAVRKIPPELTDDTNSTTTELQFEYFALSLLLGKFRRKPFHLRYKNIVEQLCPAAHEACSERARVSFIF